VTASNLKDPLNLGRRRWMLLGTGRPPQPTPDGPPGQSGIRSSQGAGVRGIDVISQLVQQSGLIA
jgi:hypothetical protein